MRVSCARRQAPVPCHRARAVPERCTAGATAGPTGPQLACTFPVRTTVRRHGQETHALPGLPVQFRPAVAAAPARAAPGSAALAAAHRRHADAQARRRQRGDVAAAPDALEAGLCDRLGHHVTGRGGAGGGGRSARPALRHAASLSQARQRRPATGAAGGAALGTLRDAAARNDPHPAAGPRRLHHGLAQRARRAAARRPLRSRRLHRAHDAVPAEDRPGGACGRRLPALCRRPGGRGADGGERRPGAAAQPDAHGGPGRLPRESHRRQPARHQQADRVVPQEPAMCRCRMPVSCARSIRASCSSRPSSA